MAETAGHQFFQKVLLECNWAQQATRCAFSDVSVQGKLGAARVLLCTMISTSNGLLISAPGHSRRSWDVRVVPGQGVIRDMLVVRFRPCAASRKAIF